ncbi:MAG: hypothetical protein O7A09_02815 [Proteobacteria bacterium]|nr:hypothetical protein [Pseudomonadota bacterium]
MRAATLGLIAALALLLAAPAWAQQASEPDYERGGLYVALESSYVRGIDGRVDNEWAFRGRIGLKFMKFFGIEFQYEGYGTISGPAMPINLKLYLPMGRIQPWLVGGGGPWQVRNPSGSYTWGGQVVGGGGVDIYITENWAAVVSSEYQHGTGAVRANNLVTAGAGVMYRF